MWCTIYTDVAFFDWQWKSDKGDTRENITLKRFYVFNVMHCLKLTANGKIL